MSKRTVESPGRSGPPDKKTETEVRLNSSLSFFFEPIEAQDFDQIMDEVRTDDAKFPRMDLILLKTQPRHIHFRHDHTRSLSKQYWPGPITAYGHWPCGRFEPFEGTSDTCWIPPNNEFWGKAHELGFLVQDDTTEIEQFRGKVAENVAKCLNRIPSAHEELKKAYQPMLDNEAQHAVFLNLPTDFECSNHIRFDGKGGWKSGTKCGWSRRKFGLSESYPHYRSLTPSPTVSDEEVIRTLSQFARPEENLAESLLRRELSQYCWACPLCSFSELDLREAMVSPSSEDQRSKVKDVCSYINNERSRFVRIKWWEMSKEEDNRVAFLNPNSGGSRCQNRRYARGPKYPATECDYVRGQAFKFQDDPNQWNFSRASRCAVDSLGVGYPDHLYAFMDGVEQNPKTPGHEGGSDHSDDLLSSPNMSRIIKDAFARNQVLDK